MNDECKREKKKKTKKTFSFVRRENNKFNLVEIFESRGKHTK